MRRNSQSNLDVPAEQHNPLDELNVRIKRDRGTLINVVTEVANAFPLVSLQRIFSAKTNRFFDPHRMLALITYHYATGIYSSEAISTRVANGTSGNWPDAEVPDAHAIRRFRNRNRLPVRQCLEKSLIRFYETGAASGRPVPQFDRLMKTDAGIRMHQAEIADLGCADV
jgi:transposase